MDKKYFKRIGVITAIILLCTGLFFILEVISPELLYRFNKPDQQEIIESIKQYEATQSLVDNKIIEHKEPKYKENRLIIPKIGVDVEISSDKNLLDSGKGGWMQEVNKNNLPLFIAVHRFGWNNITPDEKMKQTLYHVYKLEKGDKVIVLWEGEKYEYEVKELSEGENNPVVEEGGLVIYTCRFFDSLERIFVELSV